ncbi:MAG TPA: GntR family transcriptional regulator [Candidatus Blautia avistercoris]|uniref:GntR family transcriptional regulator n=1 Tax=Blautia sp. An249 TaxID=1965603 RepID=UPI000B38B3B6|nr:GntR family transcriptional regulator [Blautia sp. An249]OUO78893.1 GntR family transcriptional regulator [Blautia sp. An249]HIY18443.1 GntR family transcriptional regulator [Candidatus Blautia avistercoris]
MTWNLDSNRPIYAQIIEKIQLDIVSGRYKPKDKLPSVRDLASDASVNPNTMQKALSELERTGLVYSQRTSGRFITEDITMIEKLKETLASTQIQEFLEKMNQMGFDKKETLQLIEKILREDKS